MKTVQRDRFGWRVSELVIQEVAKVLLFEGCYFLEVLICWLILVLTRLERLVLVELG